MERRPADFYDAFYEQLEKDYASEARTVLDFARGKGPKPRTLLDVACGTGRHLEHFSRKLRCVGVDLDPAMLEVAVRRCPDVAFVHADMIDLDLGETFDVVTCLFSSVAYMGTVPRLRRAVAAMARHLNPGGSLVIEPWYQPKQWEVGHLTVLTVNQLDRVAVRVSHATRDGDLSALDFHYLIADADGVEHFHDRHELRLFRWKHYVDALGAAGLQKVKVDKVGLWGHGLAMGRAPTESSSAELPG